MEFCKYCGEEVKVDSKFSNHCGEQLRETKTDDKSNPNPTDTQLNKDLNQEETENDGVKEENEVEVSVSEDEVTSKSDISATSGPDSLDEGQETEKQTGNKQPVKSKGVLQKNILIFSGLGLIVLLIIGFVILNKKIGRASCRERVWISILVVAW